MTESLPDDLTIIVMALERTAEQWRRSGRERIDDLADRADAIAVDLGNRVRTPDDAIIDRLNTDLRAIVFGQRTGADDHMRPYLHKVFDASKAYASDPGFPKDTYIAVLAEALDYACGLLGIKNDVTSRAVSST